jgi:PAS domain S-box-containing protein
MIGGPEIGAASEARLRVLIEVAPDGIFVTRDGTILYVNRAGACMLGVADPQELINMPLAAVLTPHELAAGTERLASVQQDRLLPVRSYDVRRRDGKAVTVEATSLAIEWDGAPAALTFGRDITERLRLEEKLSRADRLAALGVLAAGVAHEINNPLAFVSLGFDRLERLLHTMPEVRSEALALLGELRGGLERVAAITRDLRTFARDRAEPSTGSSDLVSVLASVERLVAHQLRYRTRLVVEVPADLPQIRIASLRLEQVFVNLLVNAAEALVAGSEGLIIVRARRHGDDRVIVEVVDNGPGIPPAVLARMFEPFFTTKATTTGTGLGLAISHTIVTEAGGDLSVESVVARGTTFRIDLPVAVATADAAPPVERATRAHSRARILIVDDEPAIADSLSSLLATDHDVEILTSSKDALTSLLGGATYDLVLCDLMMPQMTGMDLHDRLARARPGEEAKIVFMTGGAFTDPAHGFLARVPNRYVEKPFIIGELEAILEDVLADKGSA